MTGETRPCGCGKKMILVRLGEMVLMSHPPVYPMRWHCFGCGATTAAPDYRPPTEEEINRRRWEEANKQPEGA